MLRVHYRLANRPIRQSEGKLFLDQSSYGVYFHGIYVRDEETGWLMSCVKIGMGRLLTRHYGLCDRARELKFSAVDDVSKYMILTNKPNAKKLEVELIDLIGRLSPPLAGKHQHIPLKEWFSCGWEIFSMIVRVLDRSKKYTVLRSVPNIVVLDGGRDLLWDNQPKLLQEFFLD